MEEMAEQALGGLFDVTSFNLQEAWGDGESTLWREVHAAAQQTRPQRFRDQDPGRGRGGRRVLQKIL